LRVFLDTNILISAALWPKSIPWQAYEKAIAPPNVAIICEYTIDELFDVFNRKFPDKIPLLESFLARAYIWANIVDTPVALTTTKGNLRDPNDEPILLAAVESHADVLVTGDKDFLESGVTDPTIITATEFLHMS
jgi:putative PIN family toxin of toxin-antitoxin system